MIPEIPFNRALTLFYLQNVTPVGQDLLQIRSYVYAEEPPSGCEGKLGVALE